MPILVPNEPPTLLLPQRLAIIGEAPGEKEELMHKPFVGYSGQLLQAVMGEHGLIRSACFMGNISLYRPPDNRIEAFAWDGPEIQRGLETLRHEIRELQPNAILLLGTTPLKAAGITFPVTSFRGSIFTCHDSTSPFFGFKCISTLHPAYVLRSYETLPLFSFDVRRAAQESLSPLLTTTPRTYATELTASDIIARLDAITAPHLISVDIEGGIEQGITCVGIATSPGDAFIVNHNDFGDSERVRILRSLGRVLTDPSIKKVLQNSLYDNFCLAWKLGIPIRGVAWDTMLSGWEIYPELPKGLETQTSIWTDQPYYKFQRKIEDSQTHYKYCCTDAAVTFEIMVKQKDAMSAAQLKHLRFNQDLLNPVMYMELHGIRYDIQRAKDRLEETKVCMMEIQSRIDRAAGESLNVNSPKQMINILYRKLGFEPQYKKEHGRKTESLTADVEALLNLSKSYDAPIVSDILKWRSLEGQRKQLEIGADKDGRIRCSYNVVGTETGRFTCYESPTGSGTNLTTIMKSNRDLFVADPGYFLFECDLSGADGWTVAAHCNRLGDDTMLLDYLCEGFKPAKWLAMVYRDHSIASLSRSDLLTLMPKCPQDWLYECTKVVQHGSNYDMGKNTMSKNILIKSYKKSCEAIFVSPKDCEALQKLYFNGRYRGVYHWRHWVKTQLEKTRSLGCASGHIRTFFGRPTDQETLKTALSHEPQANTTYATNLALHRLWHDPENRVNNNLIIQPLHQVHDALIGQFPEERTDWARAKIRSYFNNSITIAEQEIVIPFEGGYGESWGKHPFKI